MSPKPTDESDDKAEVTPPNPTSIAPVSRHDEIVREQFVWEVGETLDLIRAASMGGSAAGGVDDQELFTTCIQNMADLGRSLDLREFVVEVEALAQVLLDGPLDGPLVDKHIDQVSHARWAWPTS